ncbi:hypothetical protein ACOME3_002635 [Neoechinorhynchus agilis]
MILCVFCYELISCVILYCLFNFKIGRLERFSARSASLFFFIIQLPMILFASIIAAAEGANDGSMAATAFFGFASLLWMSLYYFMELKGAFESRDTTTDTGPSGDSPMSGGQ